MTISGENNRSINQEQTEVVNAQERLSYEKLQGNLLIPENSKKKDNIFLYFAVCTDECNKSNTSVDELTEVVYRSLSYEKSAVKLVKTKNGTKKDSLFLYFSVISVNLLPLVGICTTTWSSPVIPKLQAADPATNPLGTPVTHIQESLIASLPLLGSLIGPLLFGKLLDRYGRKKPLIFLGVLTLACYLVLSFATEIYLYYIPRFLLGFGIGIPYAIVPMYVAELCEDHNRGKFGCVLGIFGAVGVLYALSVGPFLSIKLFSISCTLPLIAFLFCMVFLVPESPVFLVSRGYTEEAQKALMKLRNISPVAAEKDCVEIRRVLEKSSKGRKGGCGDLIKCKSSRKALLISVVVVAVPQLSGVNTITSFIEPILNASGSALPGNIVAILIGVVQLLTILIAASLVENLGRKKLLLISSAGSFISLLCLGLYFYLEDTNYSKIKSFSWLPAACLIVYILFFNLGLGPIPWAILGEIFPSHLKSIAASITILFAGSSAFLTTLVYPITSQLVGKAFCFWFFSGVSIVGMVFITFVVPETKGKSLLEIQMMLGGTLKS